MYEYDQHIKDILGEQQKAVISVVCDVEADIYVDKKIQKKKVDHYKTVALPFGQYFVEAKTDVPNRYDSAVVTLSQEGTHVCELKLSDKKYAKLTIVCDTVADFYVDKKPIAISKSLVTHEVSLGEHFVEVKTSDPDQYESAIVNLTQESGHVCEFKFSNKDFCSVTFVCDIKADYFVDKELVANSVERAFTHKLPVGEHFVEVKSYDPPKYDSRVISVAPEGKLVCEFFLKKQMPGLFVEKGVPVSINFTEDCSLELNGVDVGNFEKGVSEHFALPVGKNRFKFVSVHLENVSESIELNLKDIGQEFVDSKLDLVVQKRIREQLQFYVMKLKDLVGSIKGRYSVAKLQKLMSRLRLVAQDRILYLTLESRVNLAISAVDSALNAYSAMEPALDHVLILPENITGHDYKKICAEIDERIEKWERKKSVFFSLAQDAETKSGLVENDYDKLEQIIKAKLLGIERVFEEAQDRFEGLNLESLCTEMQKAAGKIPLTGSVQISVDETMRDIQKATHDFRAFMDLKSSASSISPGVRGFDAIQIDLNKKLEDVQSNKNNVLYFCETAKNKIISCNIQLNELQKLLEDKEKYRRKIVVIFSVVTVLFLVCIGGGIKLYLDQEARFQRANNQRSNRQTEISAKDVKQPSVKNVENREPKEQAKVVESPSVVSQQQINIPAKPQLSSLEQGKIYMKKGEYDKAENSLRGAIESYKNAPASKKDIYICNTMEAMFYLAKIPGNEMEFDQMLKYYSQHRQVVRHNLPGIYGVIEPLALGLEE
ncbi:hypothetical protein [Desulfovibrio gilichinskyi]|uniref:Uncharacterized protein n=1 Tax=Desulfovibrio gilichinskyi TaxID=1519643 RepID=A0A1X7C0S7_9BACT|nr:hypothetical protein [Desulfovibrio gilichinskyi]SME87838.1 hypothetical protein SAMN06295933_0052 [Desulfovibrio gilichinskyi]